MTSETDEVLWQQHTLNYLEMAFRTDRMGAIRHCDGHGEKTGDCGDTVQFFINVKAEKIDRAAYMSNGCMHTNACANAVLNLIEGQRVDHAWEVTPEAVTRLLKSLPHEHFHCAELSVGALYLALADATKMRSAPWKKMYR